MSGKGSGGQGTGDKSVTGGWTNSSGSTCTNQSEQNPSSSTYNTWRAVSLGVVSSAIDCMFVIFGLFV